MSFDNDQKGEGLNMCLKLLQINVLKTSGPPLYLIRGHSYTSYKKGEGLNMCFIFKFWLPKYRTEIALGVGNTNLNSKIKE